MKPHPQGYFLFVVFVALALNAEPALADVCQQVRPGWSPEEGPVTMFGELITRLFSGGGIFLIMATALAVKVNRFIFSLIVALGWLGVAALHQFVVYHPVGIDVPAHEIGCIGSPILAIVLFVAIGVALIIWQVINLRRRSQ